MPALGTGIFGQGAGFSIPRSLIYGVVISMDEWPAVELAPGHYQLTHYLHPDWHVWFRLKDEFVTWSSNNYTLGWVMAESYFFDTVALVDVPLNYNFSTYFPTTRPYRHLYISVPGFGEVRQDFFTLPPPSDDYWLPIPPGAPI